MLLAVMLCDGSSSSSETSPVTSLSLSTSICKTELTAPCYPTKSLGGQTNSIVGKSGNLKMTVVLQALGRSQSYCYISLVLLLI